MENLTACGQICLLSPPTLLASWYVWSAAGLLSKSNWNFPIFCLLLLYKANRLLIILFYYQSRLWEVQSFKAALLSSCILYMLLDSFSSTSLLSSFVCNLKNSYFTNAKNKQNKVKIWRSCHLKCQIIINNPLKSSHVVKGFKYLQLSKMF